MQKKSSFMVPGIFAVWAKDLLETAALAPGMRRWMWLVALVLVEKMTPELLKQTKAKYFENYKRSTSPDGFHKVSRALFAFATKGAL